MGVMILTFNRRKFPRYNIHSNYLPKKYASGLRFPVFCVYLFRVDFIHILQGYFTVVHWGNRTIISNSVIRWNGDIVILTKF